MLTTGAVTDACLGVSLHVSRAAGDEGALPVHASLRFPRLGINGGGRIDGVKKKSGKARSTRRGSFQGPWRWRSDPRVRAGTMYRIRTGTRPERRWGVTPSSLLCAAADGRVPSWENHLHAGYNITPSQARSRRDDMPSGHRSGLPTGPCEPWISDFWDFANCRGTVSRISPSHSWLSPARHGVRYRSSLITHRSSLTVHTRFLLGGRLSFVGWADVDRPCRRLPDLMRRKIEDTVAALAWGCVSAPTPAPPTPWPCEGLPKQELPRYRHVQWRKMGSLLAQN